MSNKKAALPNQEYIFYRPLAYSTSNIASYSHYLRLVPELTGIAVR